MPSKNYVSCCGLLGTLSLCASSLFAAPITITVGLNTDTNLSSTYGGSYLPDPSMPSFPNDPTNTDLRGALNHVNVFPAFSPEGYIITFTPNLSGTTISLGAMLPILNLVNANPTMPLIIDGGTGAPITIDGGNLFRGFLARQGNVTLKNLTIQNVKAAGGNGGASMGGGGMGAGAGLLIAEDANVTLSNVSIHAAQAIGGIGASSGTGGGGGGLGGNGGSDGGGGGGIGGLGGSTSAPGVGGGGGINCGGSHSGSGGTGSGGAEGGGVGGAKAGDGFTFIPPPNLGGANGGGGGASSTIVGSGGGGGDGGANASGGSPGGGGGFGGGGGGGNININGGDGGFGGGGGGSLGVGFNGKGGNGNFGGGGGGGGGSTNQGSNGGFGGGGGGGGGGVGGVGGGQSLSSGAGGSGAGFGGAIFVNSSGTLTIQNSFSTGMGNSVIAGTGVNPGWKAGDDAFFVTGASITFDPNGSSITITNSIADDSSASFIGAPSGVTMGSGAGASITIGNPSHPSGTVQFPSTNHSTYSGPTLIQRGTLVLNGSIMSPVTVFSGAKLQGTGTINNLVNVNSGGTIHAGNSIGTITVGNLTLASQANLALDIDLSPGSSASSIYMVNGHLALNNATLVLAFASQSSPPTAHTYDFIHYTGDSSGTFNPVIVNVPAGLHATVNYLPNLVQLKLSLLPVVIGAGVDLSHNQKVVLKYLLALSSVPSLEPILRDLARLTPDQLRSALDSISPARNAAASFFINQVVFAIGKIPLDRLAEGRILRFTGNNGSHKKLGAALALKNENLFAMADQIPSPATPTGFDTSYESNLAQNQTASYMPAGKVRTAASKPQNYGFWASGFGDFLSQDEQHSNPEIHDIASGVILGFDYYGYQNGMFAISTGYIHNDISEDCDVGSGTSNGGVLSLYGTGNIGNGYIEGGFLWGYNRFNMLRRVALAGSVPFCATAESSFNQWMIMPHLSGGYDWMMDWGVVEPFGSIDWAVSFQETYKEKGAFPLNTKIRSVTPSILRSQLGINFYETCDYCENHTFIFQQSASYINKALFNTKMKASIIIAPTALPAGAPGSFTVWTYDEILNLGGIGVEVFYKHKPSGFFLSGAYQGEFGTSYMSNDITGTLGIFF